MKLTKEEQLIQFFLQKYENSKTNEVSISKSDLSQLNLTEQEASRSIYLLQEENLLTITQKSVHDDFSIYWKVKLTAACVHYFENKQEQKIQNRRSGFEEFRQWVTLIVALLGFGLSIYSIYLQYVVPV